MALSAKGIYVVGGTGGLRHDDNGGGYVEGETADYVTCQSIAGAPTSNPTTWNAFQTACDATNNGSGFLRIELNGGGVAEFVNCVVGTIVYIHGAGIVGGPHYQKVTLVEGAGQYIDIDKAFVGVDTCDIHVGGAFATLQHALDVVDATDYSMDIHINLDTTLAATLDDDILGGTVLKNTHRRVIGFNTALGDMSRGGTYHQTPIESYNDGIHADSFIVIDADGLAFPALTIDGMDNTVWENLYFYNTDQAAGDNGVAFLNTPESAVFKNCRFDVLFKGVDTGCNGVLFIECANGPACTNQIITLGSGGAIITGVFQEPTLGGQSVIGVATGVPGFIESNVVIGADYGMRINGHTVCKNNVCYNQAIVGIKVQNAGAALTVYNNICVIQPGVSHHGILIEAAAGGSIAYNDYNCIVDTNGTPLIDPVYSSFVGGTAPVLGDNSIEEAPLFIDAANGDFRLQPGSPCLNTGKPMLNSDALSEGYSSMGVWQQKQRGSMLGAMNV